MREQDWASQVQPPADPRAACSSFGLVAVVVAGALNVGEAPPCERVQGPVWYLHMAVESTSSQRPGLGQPVKEKARASTHCAPTLQGKRGDAPCLQCCQRCPPRGACVGLDFTFFWRRNVRSVRERFVEVVRDMGLRTSRAYPEAGLLTLWGDDEAGKERKRKPQRQKWEKFEEQSRGSPRKVPSSP